MAKASSRSAAAKKAWVTRRKLYGKSGVSKGSKSNSNRLNTIKSKMKKQRSAAFKNMTISERKTFGRGGKRAGAASYNKKTHYMKYGGYGAPRLVKRRKPKK